MNSWPDRYTHFSISDLRIGQRSLRAIHIGDAEVVRMWRNEQLDVLRQPELLSEAEQISYFENIVRPQLEIEQPAQVLVAYLDGDELIGYGGIVHISWPDLRGEVSFLMSAQRAGSDSYEDDFRIFLELLLETAREGLGLHRVFTETYEIRDRHLAVLESVGFTLEGRMRDHVRIQGQYVDALIHGFLL